MKYLILILLSSFLLACKHEDANDIESLKNSLNGKWSTECIYVGVSSDTSLIKTITFSGNEITRVNTTYQLSNCEGEVLLENEIVNTASVMSKVLVDGYDSVCISLDDGNDLIYHLDGRYLYETVRLDLHVEGYTPPPLDCLDFEDNDIEVYFSNPYIKEI